VATRTVIPFPYRGYEAKSPRETNFRKVVDKCGAATGTIPIIVLNRDTVERGTAKTFLQEFEKSGSVEIVRVWSVDTCQMWLAGWGYVLDQYPRTARIAQVPGDIEHVADQKKFFANLVNFLHAGQPAVVVGDFATGEHLSAKDLIDRYGTLPLLANWFPEVSRGILDIPLSKPRSEFLNIKREVLRTLLENRKFAYEQTLNMLIRLWYTEDFQWTDGIAGHDLGVVGDDSAYREYRDCLDQVERTERMLRLIWREIREPEALGDPEKYREYIKEYIDLDQRSTAIRETAIITIRNLIGPVELAPSSGSDE
jgi:hypothetical protein